MGTSPLKSVHFGRWSLAYCHGRRFWKWLPRRQAYWRGQVVYWSWLCFQVGVDRRTDMLGDWMGHRADDGRRG